MTLYAGGQKAVLEAFMESREISITDNMTEQNGDVGTAKEAEDSLAALKAEFAEMKDKYLRLYAEFENYKKKTQKDKEELLRYGNESLIYDLLPVIDTLEIALKHLCEGDNDKAQSLTQGIENTLREFLRVLEKFGLKSIEAAGKPFDPAYHHAMSRIEGVEHEDNIVVEEFRKGYVFNNKVLRPSLVAVFKKTRDNLN
jgi:molecular chaperone GrpE